MKPFILLRVDDVSGSSGTGRVAEGMESSHGWVVLFFADSMKWFPSVEKMMEVHSHDGRTRLHYVTMKRSLEDANPELAARLREYALTGDGQTRIGSPPPIISPADARSLLHMLGETIRVWQPMPPPEAGLYLVRSGSNSMPGVARVEVSEGEMEINWGAGPSEPISKVSSDWEWTPLRL